MDLRDQIRNADDLTTISEPIPCPEWGDGVALHVRILSGSERDAFEEASLVKKGKKRELSLQDARARLVEMAACDPAGKPIFRAGDAKWLTLKNGAVLSRLFAAAMKLNAITEDDIEELVGNSESGPSAVSGSS